MADKEIKLVGSFKDDITPKLRKLNREITAVTQSFSKMQSKLRPIARDMGTLAMASERVAQGMRAQRSSMEANIRAMQQYKTTVGQVARAQRAIKPTVLPTPQQPRAPRGRSAPPPVYGGGGGGGMAAGAFGVTLGGTLSNMMTNAIVRGFQIGTSLMFKPFQFLQRGLAERIADEMSDVRAAGGLFSISRRMQGGGFVSNFAEAENLTKETNRYLAELAGALPGDTQEYINVSKQISDGIYTMISNDKENSIKLAQKIAQENGRILKETQGKAGMQEAGKELVGEMTKLTVLAGLGGQQGAFGLPQLTEQMISKDEVTMGMFTKYAAIFRDPMIKGALERNLQNINQAGANTADRMEAIRNTFREIVTPELVRRYQRTTSGVIEALKTTFLNPEVGLLGLGRPLAISAQVYDQFGKAVFKNGKAVTESQSIFDYLRDIFANVMIVLQPVIEAATKLFDPFTALGKQLNRLRDATMMFQRSFEQYRLGLENIAKGLKGEQKASFQATLTLRAALAAVNNAFVNLGVYGEAEFQKIAAIIKDPTKGFGDFAKVIQDMVTKFLSSEGAAKIGEAIGGIIGTVVSTVGQMMAQVAGIATGGKLAEGFARGFKAAGGTEGFANIIKGVFGLFGKLLLEVFKAAPLEVTLISSLMLFGPAIAAAIGTALVGAIPKMLGKALSGNLLKGLPMGPGRIKGRPQALMRPGLEKGKNLLSGITKAPTGSVSGLAQAGGATGKALNLFGGAAAKNFMAGLKAVSPKLLAFGGVLSAIIALFEGKGIAGALAAGLGSAGGTAIGAAIGTVIFPGVGTALGAAIGGWVGSLEVVTRPLTEVFSAIGDTLGPTFQGLADTLGSIFSSLWSAFSMFFPSIGGATNAMDGVTATIIAIKVVLAPIVAAFQLLEQTVNVLLVAFRGLETGILGLRLLLAKANPFGNKKAQEQLEKEYQDSLKRTNEAVGRFGKAFERHKKYYETAPVAGSTPAGVKPAPVAAKPQMADIRGSAAPGSSTAAGAQASLPQQISQALVNLDVAMLPIQKWFQNLPYNLGMAIGSAIGSLQAKITEFTAWWSTLGPRIGQATTNAANSIKQSIANFAAFLGSPEAWGQLFTSIRTGFTNGLTQLGGWLSSLVSNFMSGLRAGQATANQPKATPKYNGKGRSMPLGQAIATEMKHKPAGSSLVIANSSETVIPAYRGYNMNKLHASSAAGGFGGGGRNVSMNGITINVNGTNKNGREIAEEIAGQLLAAMETASYTELYTS